MAEYGYPQKALRVMRRICVGGASALTAYIVADCLFNKFPDAALPYFGLVGHEVNIIVRHPGEIMKLRLLLAAGAVVCILLGWGVLLSCAFLLRKFFGRTYVVEDGALVRKWGKREKRVEFGASTLVRCGRHDLSVRIGMSRMSVPMSLESADELAGALKERVLAAGGEFSEATYEKAVATALEGKWQADQLWEFVAMLLAGLAVAAGGAYAIVGRSSEMLLASMGAAVSAYCVIMLPFAFYGVPWRFRRWRQPGWQAPGTAYTWGTFGLWALISAGVPLVFLGAVFL